MRTAYVGLGANLGERAAQLRGALAALGSLPDTGVLRVSGFYRSPPMGPADQPDFCNAVCRLQTALAPRELLEAMIDIERAAGRVRGTERWGPRLLDLDLLHVPGVVCDEPGLHLPHPGLARRAFVLVPLVEVEPGLVIPGIGAVADCLRRLAPHDLRPWSESAAPNS